MEAATHAKGGAMRARSALALVLILVAAPDAIAGSAAGTWRRLPVAPVRIDSGLTGVWTGRQMLVFGVTGVAPDGSFLKAVNVGEAYDPAARAWRRLPKPPGAVDREGSHAAVWTGSRVLVTSPFATLVFNPASGRWRRLGRGHGGLVVWTGRELIGWGGGCCGDAFSDGAAYDPATNRWRTLPRSPLAGSARPIGAWTGKELIVLVGNLDPDGKPWPARLARAAAYDPANNTWRRIAPLPEPRGGASAVWDGRELLVVGGAGDPRGGKPAPFARAGFAYDPVSNRWRRLAPMPSGRVGASVVWAGTRLLVWGGQTAPDARPESPPRGLAYDPRTNRWSALPRAPLSGRIGQTAVWAGHALLVWGGGTGRPPYAGFRDGAAFTP
jgi:N-acetylneuraminic acid mutarotase